MSDKHASEKTSQVSPDELASRESSSASDALFDDFSQGARQLFRGGLQLCEKVHDSAASFLAFGDEDAAEDHTKALEKEAAQALKRGDMSAAKHFIKRDLAFTGWSQGYDDEDTLRLLKELKSIEQAEKQRETERQAERKTVKASPSAQSMYKLGDMILHS